MTTFTDEEKAQRKAEFEAKLCALLLEYGVTLTSEGGDYTSGIYPRIGYSAEFASVYLGKSTDFSGEPES